MRKILVLGMLLALLSGCGEQKSFETVMDTDVEQPQARAMQPVVNLPSEAISQVFSEEEAGQVYFCDEYMLTVEVLQGGDLQKTVQEVTGFAMDQLPILQTVQGDAKRYVCAWSAAGESGEQIGRMCILDDGSYHYVLTAMADAEAAGELTQGPWKEIFNSFRIMAPEDVVSSGS